MDKINAVKVLIFAGGKVGVFWSQTIHVGVKYAIASFTTRMF